MSGSRKRLWVPFMSFNAAFQEILGFVKRCEEKNLPLHLNEPTLYRAYLMTGAWSMNGGREISHFMRFQSAHDPELDQARVAVSRLLSIAAKAHYFLAGKATIPHEPVVISVPDLAHPGRWQYGLVYPLDIPSDRGPSQSRSLVVAEWDLNLSAAQRPLVPKADEFPVVLSPDPRTWLTKKKWDTLKEKIDSLPWFEPMTNPAKQKLMSQVQSHTDASNFPYGTLLDAPIELKDDAAAAGAIWARGVKKWFLPTGFDAEPVQAYLKKLLDCTIDERHRRRWWDKREEKRDVRPTASKSSS